MKYYRLEGQTPVPCADLQAWCAPEWEANRRVAIDKIGPFIVSTVFLGIDHNHTDEGPPLLFETMIFVNLTKSTYGEYQRRCSTWTEAEEMHRKAVQTAKKRQAARKNRKRKEAAQ